MLRTSDTTAMKLHGFLKVFLLSLFSLTGCQSDQQGVQNRGADTEQWWDALPRPSWSNFARVAQSQEWFEVYDVAPGVFAIYEPGQFEEVISYLIVGDDRAVLFDTGLGIGDMKRLVQELTEVPILVINSHSHYDHIGGNHQFDQILGTDTPYTRQRSQGLSKETVSEFVGPGWIWKDLPAGFDKNRYEIRPFSLTGILTDQQTVDLGNRRLTVLITPGHAPDSVCLLDRDNGLLFTGDTFYPAPLYTHLTGSDFDRYQQTAQRLAKLEEQVEFVMPGHNETKLPAVYLSRLASAFDSIESGTAPFTMTEGHRQYQFDGFSIITE